MSSSPIVLIALGILLVLLGLVLRATARLDLLRSVLVRAPAATTWQLVRRVPDLLALHGKVRERGGIDDWVLRRGSGEEPGSIWHGRGRFGAEEYWADVEVVRCDAEREVALRLVRDSLGTHRGLRDHLGSLRLEPVAPGATKLTWRLRARLRGPRLRLARLLSPDALRARLLDQGLRSIKVAIEAAVGPATPAAGAPAPGARPAASDSGASPGPPPSPRPPEATA